MAFEAYQLSHTSSLSFSEMGEQNFAQSMQLVSYDMWEFISRPIVAVLVFAALATIVANVIRALRGRG